MSAVAETSFAIPADDRLARRNAAVLAIAQALSGANNAVLASSGGILGVMLAPDKGLATLPISVMVVGMTVLYYVRLAATTNNHFSYLI